jgi:hypothetical protein
MLWSTPNEASVARRYEAPERISADVEHWQWHQDDLTDYMPLVADE